jgi:hypothetical protein
MLEHYLNAAKVLALYVIDKIYMDCVRSITNEERVEIMR